MIAGKQISNVMKYLFSNKLISARDGNVSFKPKHEKHFFISPTQVKKDNIHPDDVIKVHFDDKGELKYNNERCSPSREIFMHSFLLTNELYINKDVFVIHAHPPNIISYIGFDRHRELNTIKNIFPEINVGKIGKNVNYHDAGTLSLAQNCYDNLLHNDLVGLEKHGSLSIGTDSDEIIESIETVEYYIDSYLKSDLKLKDTL